jgi:4-hydroxyphenylpyruvate dioxygenase
LGAELEKMGFVAVARHRSREVRLYRQGSVNIVVNADPEDARVTQALGGNPVISAVGFRVKDAPAALRAALDIGAWEAAIHPQAMELKIPAVHGPGACKFFFVDRCQDFSIFDIDFVALDQQAGPALKAGIGVQDLSLFGVVQYLAAGRTSDWVFYYQNLFGFSVIPDEQRFGILPKGHLMKSPCGRFLWQLIEPLTSMDNNLGPERLERMGLGVADVPSAVKGLKARGVEFIESDFLHPDDRGALTRAVMGSVSFELVHREGKNQVERGA